MNEYILNLHMHTPLSDGEGSYDDILAAALDSGIDAVIVTDHNVWVKGVERILESGGRQAMLLVGEEVHDQARDPQKNHLLVFDANRELARYAGDPQKLIDQVQESGGLSFLAHPMETDLPAFHEPDISWVDWQVSGFSGIELWNGLSEFKAVVRNKLESVYYAFFPDLIGHGPPPVLLNKWDELTATGMKVVAIGGSDAHALRIHLGLIFREVFPYRFHFRAVNTHLLLEEEPRGEIDHDRRLVYSALRHGHCFIGYDLPAPTRGFRFSARSGDHLAVMGDDLSLQEDARFEIMIPGPAECRLIRNGQMIKRWSGQQRIEHSCSEPGTYRVECRIRFRGKMRGWIFSNPIYVHAGLK